MGQRRRSVLSLTHCPGIYIQKFLCLNQLPGLWLRERGCLLWTGHSQQKRYMQEGTHTASMN
jgi:hypothetical protein